ncbi:Ig-like domain-containing protein [Hymenobacter norwichensis]|uniref:Ig-like domain-containing protein n=1 Tax=Hymenobacter norwichensis TaxID=223903 RepID=UPI0003B460DC|nr:Ig-like domain-containing protein [Hymenobacter norwichensis]
MKTTLRFSLLLLGWLGLTHTGQAQCPAGATTTLDLGSRNGEDWDITTAPNLDNPLGSNIGGTLTDVTPGSYTTAASSPASYLQVRQYGTLLGLGDESRQLDYNTLEWFADYSSSAAKSASVTLAFSRPLYNYTITLQDIDRAAGTTPGFVDEVRLDGYDVNGNLVSLPANSFTYNTTYQTIAGNTVTGLSDISNTSSTTGLVTVSFPVAITQLVLTYSNGTTNANPAQQAIGISQMTWCKVQPVAKNDSRDVPLNTTVNGNVVLNDYDEEQNPFTATLLTSPANGSVTFNPDGTYRYSPNTNYTGPDSFTYRVCNSSTGNTSQCSGTATVNLRVYSTNTACTSASGSNLIANADFNAGNTGFATTYRYVATAYNGNTNSGVYPEGTYTVGSNATTYHPNFQGTGHTAGVTNDKFLIVNGASAIRTFYSQTVTVQPNRYYTFSAFFNNLLPPPAPATGDGIPEMGFVINGESVSGTIKAERSPDTWFSFSDIWFSGNNTQAVLEIRNVSTAIGGNDLAVDDVYFGSCNLAPTAIADAATTARNVPAVVSVLANDIDTDSNNSFNTSSIDIDPTQAGTQNSRTIANQGTFAVNPSTGVVTFTPVPGFIGTAVTSYVALDGSGAPTNPASLVVTVQMPTADLVVNVTAPANNATVAAGQPVTFTVQTTNNGTTAADGVAPTVQLPAGLTGPGTNGALVFSNGGSYDVATGLVTFPTVASLAGNSSVTNSVTFSAPGNGPFTGTAAVAAGTADLSTADNTAVVTVNVSSAFDLSTTISSPATAGAGTPFAFSVVTRNAGPAAATGVVQTVSLAGNHKGLFISNMGTATYDSNANTTIVTFPAQDIPAGQSRNNTISLIVAAAGTVTASATVPALAGESSTANNSATASTVLNAATGTAANVYSTLTTTSNGSNVTSVAAAAPLTLNLTTSNAGPGTATAVQPRLSLPADLNPATLTISNGGTYDPATGVVSWSTPVSLASGATVVNSVQMPAPGFGPLLLHASAVTATPDPVTADNGMASMVTINPTADVVTTVAGPATVTAGQRVTYTITTINKGLMPAANVQQFVRMPPAVANLTYTSNILPNSVGTLDVQPNQALLAYPVISSLAPGQSVTNMVSFDAPGTSFPAVGYATTTSADNTPANNSSTISVATTAASDVVARISGPATAVNGTPVVYSVDVRNVGTSVAGSVSTSVYLPVNLTNVVVRDAAGVVVANAYDAATGLVTLPAQTNVPVGASGTSSSTITFNAPDVAAITATAVASVTTGTNDLNRTNNASTATTSVSRSGAVIVDMATTVQANTTSQVPGQPVTFTVTTTNSGPAAATTVVQRVALPAQLAAGSVTVSNGGTYDPASGIVSWQYALQGVGSANALTNTVMVAAPGTGPLTAVASVNSDNSDGTPANNTNVSSVTITPALNLRSVVRGPSTQASVLTGSVVAGQPVTYLLRALNDGPSAAQGVVFSAQIPANLNPATVSVSGGGTYVPATGAVTFPAIGTLEAGQAASAAYTVTFPAPAGMASYPVTGTVTTNSTQSTTDDTQTYTTNLANLAPVANTTVNSLTAPDGNTADSYLRLSPLSARDADGSVASFTLASVPSTTQGTLYFSTDGASFAAVTAGQVITATDADKLYFRPYSNPADPLNTNGQNFVGNAYFTYTATDNSATPATSGVTAYVLPVGQDNIALFTAGPVKGGAVPYQNGDVLTSAFDANGGEYNAATEVTDNGIRSAALASGSNALPAGTILNANTGLVTVANRLLLASGTYTVTVATTDEFGGVTTQPVTFTIGARPLPVTLSSFEAVAKGNDALLTWATATEKNNAGFEVERTADGRSFQKVGTVAGHGNSATRQQYSFIDVKAAAVASTLYYRLKQVDLDGTVNYTPVQVVRFGQSTVAPELTLYPNPATDVLHLTLTAAVQKGQVTVYSTTGALVLTKVLNSTLDATLDVSKLPQGAYLLKVTGENGVQQTRRFVKN